MPDDYLDKTTAAEAVKVLRALHDRARAARGLPARVAIDDLRAAVEALGKNATARVAPAACDECHGTGWRTRVEPRTVEVELTRPDGSREKVNQSVRAAQRCDCLRALSTNPVAVADLPSEFRDARFATYTQRLENAHAIAAAREFDAGKRKHLYVHGRATGTGKSRLVATVLNEAAARGVAGAFVRVPWLMLVQRLAIDDPAKQAEANQLLDRALQTPIVALDDVAGGEKGSDFSRGVMVTILDRRYDKNLSTVITSNLTLQELSEFYGDTRVPSRIAGACGETIELGGSDARIAQRRGGRGMRVVQ